MRGSVLGLPLWLILAVCVVPPIAYSLSRAAGVPVELILPTAVAMEVVFLTQTVQQALRRAEVRRHFHGVGTFNDEAALRERQLQKLFNVTGPATAGIFKSVKSSDKRLESWLSEVPSRLAVLMRDIQHVIGDLGHMRGVIISGDDEERLAAINHRETEAYVRWRQSHGDVATPSIEPRRDWSIHDDPIR